MHPNHPIRGLFILLLSIVMIGGTATAAQAYQPYRFSRPACVGIWPFQDCTANMVYKETLDAIDAAIASKDPLIRQGTVQQLFYQLFGGGLVAWNGAAAGHVINASYFEQAADAWQSPPSDAQLACYGNVFLDYVAGPARLNDAVANMYAAVKVFKTVKDVYGDAVNAAQLTRAFGSPNEAQGLLVDVLGDQAQITIETATGIPLTPFDLYVGIIESSEQPVKQLSLEQEFQGGVSPLESCAATGVDTIYPDAHAPAYVKHTKTVTYTAQHLFIHKTEYNAGRKNSCHRSKEGLVSCTAGGVTHPNAGYWGTTLSSAKIPLTAAARDVLAYRGTVKKRFTITITSLAGPKPSNYVDFELGQAIGGGQWTYRKPGTYHTPWITYPPATPVNAYLTQVMLGIGAHTHVTIKNVRVEYQYTVLR